MEILVRLGFRQVLWGGHRHLQRQFLELGVEVEVVSDRDSVGIHGVAEHDRDVLVDGLGSPDLQTGDELIERGVRAGGERVSFSTSSLVGLPGCFELLHPVCFCRLMSLRLLELNRRHLVNVQLPGLMLLLVLGPHGEPCFFVALLATEGTGQSLRCSRLNPLRVRRRLNWRWRCEWLLEFRMPERWVFSVGAQGLQVDVVVNVERCGQKRVELLVGVGQLSVERLDLSSTRFKVKALRLGRLPFLVSRGSPSDTGLCGFGLTLSGLSSTYSSRMLAGRSVLGPLTLSGRYLSLVGHLGKEPTLGHLSPQSV
jgi:hypothetical protein